jgi:hypothetical protein
VAGESDLGEAQPGLPGGCLVRLAERTWSRPIRPPRMLEWISAGAWAARDAVAISLISLSLPATSSMR